MTTPARIRRTLDFNRLGQALSRPGIDPRTWIDLARVDDADDAITWLEGTGWIVDVNFITGELAEEDEVPCQVATWLGGHAQGSYAPVKRGCMVVVLLPAGNANVAPVILGTLHNPEDCPAPSVVNELTITESVMLENIVLVSEDSVEAEFGDSARLRAGTWHIVGDRLHLAPDAVRGDSTQAFVRGDDFGDALGTFLDSLGTFTSTVVTAANVVWPAVAPALPAGVGSALQAWVASVANAAALLGGGAAPAIVPPVAVPFATSAAGVLKATIADAPTGWKSTRIDGE